MAGVRRLPSLRFTDGNGAATSLATSRDRVVLLNVWATWCGPCREEMPTLDRLQTALGGPHFEVVAVSIDAGGLPVIQAFFRATGVKHLHPYLDSHESKTHARTAVVVPQLSGIPATASRDPAALRDSGARHRHLRTSVPGSTSAHVIV